MYCNQSHAITLARDLFNVGLWLSIIVLDAVSIGVGSVCILMSAINAYTRHSTLLVGPLAVYISNALYTLTSMITVVLAVTSYFTDLRHNILNEQDRITHMWTSHQRVHLHFSFYLVVAASLLGAVNVGLATYARIMALRQREATYIQDKMPDGLMMY